MKFHPTLSELTPICRYHPEFVGMSQSWPKSPSTGGITLELVAHVQIWLTALSSTFVEICSVMGDLSHVHVCARRAWPRRAQAPAALAHADADISATVPATGCPPHTYWAGQAHIQGAGPCRRQAGCNTPASVAQHVQEALHPMLGRAPRIVAETSDLDAISTEVERMSQNPGEVEFRPKDWERFGGQLWCASL